MECNGDEGVVEEGAVGMFSDIALIRAPGTPSELDGDGRDVFWDSVGEAPDTESRRGALALKGATSAAVKKVLVDLVGVGDDIRCEKKKICTGRQTGYGSLWKTCKMK
jgi:hypothetical protein